MSTLLVAEHGHGSLAMGAHGIHGAVVGLGLLGLVALLSPQLLSDDRVPLDDHETRVRALRSALEQSPSSGRNTVATRAPSGHGAALTPAGRLVLPLAVVSSAAAAGAHAAVGPEHLRESVLLGAFFAATAVAQLAWSVAVAGRASRHLLHLGVLGNLSLAVLWGTTRTLGLPFGLLPAPEAVGPWDLACVAWELVVAGACVLVLRQPGEPPVRLPGWRSWHPVLPTYVAASVLVLVALTLGGAGA